jgi:transcriptional/translational regulatory protein YebC/TACO1
LPGKLDLETQELDLIDAGAEEIDEGEEEMIIYTKFADFGHMLKFLEENNIESKSAELQYSPTTTKSLSEAEQDEVLKLVEVLESDDDVQTVYHNLA